MTITVQTFNQEFRNNLKISESELKEIILEKLLEDYENSDGGLNPADIVDLIDEDRYDELERSYACANRTYIIDCLKYRIEHNHV
jgi:hypothetical protein